MECQRLHFLTLFITILVQSSLVRAVSLDATPATLQKSGDIVTFTWKGLDSPSNLDWLGIYMPPTSADDHYIGYILLSTCATWASGSCSLQMPLVNMRTPYNFRLFRGVLLNDSAWTNATVSNNVTMNIPVDGEGNPLPDISTRLAVSSIVGFANYNEPTQVHLALTSNVGEMRVMFVTRDPLRSFVRYGVDATKLRRSVEANSLTYTEIDMCDAPANLIGWKDPGYIHDAILARLKFGARYYYQVGSNEGGWSSTYSFVASNPHADETYALLFGDLGTSIPYTTFYYTQPESRNTLKWLKRDLEEVGDKPTFISHIGDISYARGYSWVWDGFFHQIEPLAANTPYHVCMGNHEYDWPAQPFNPDWSPYGIDGGGECGVPYSLRFNMPGTSSLSTGSASPLTKNLYYSIDVGVVHFLYYCTEIDFLPGSEQYAFIAMDLRTVDRRKTPFVIFLGHRPMYTTDSREAVEMITQYLVKTYEPLLIENKVSVALSGHVHKYERMCPLQNYTCVEPSNDSELPVYMVIGMGGAAHQPADARWTGHEHQLYFPQPEWSVFRTFEWGYIRLHATKHLLTLSYIGNHDGKVHDTFQLPSPDNLRAGTYFEKEQPFLEPTISEQYRGRWSLGIMSMAFVFLVGCGLGASAVLFLFHRRQLKQSWQPLSRDEAVGNI